MPVWCAVRSVWPGWEVGPRPDPCTPPPVRVSSVGLWTYGAVRSLRLVGPDTIATRDLADHRGQRRGR